VGGVWLRRLGGGGNGERRRRRRDRSRGCMGGGYTTRICGCRRDTAATLVTCRGTTAVNSGVVVVVVWKMVVLDGIWSLWGADSEPTRKIWIWGRHGT